MSAFSFFSFLLLLAVIAFTSGRVMNKYEKSEQARHLLRVREDTEYESKEPPLSIGKES